MGKPGQLTQQPGHVVIDVGFGGDEVEGGDTPIHAQSYTDAMLHRRNGRNQISRAGKPGTNTDFLSTYRPTINRRNTIIAQPHTHTHTHAQSSSQTGANDSNGLKEGVFVRPPRPAYLADYRQRSTRNRTNGWALSVKQKLQAMGQLPAVSSTNGYESDDAINSLAHRGRVVMKKGSLEWVFDISQDTHGRTPLHIAAAKGDLQSVMSILQTKYSDPSSSTQGQDMMVDASSSRKEYAMGRAKSFETGLMDINVNARDRMGNTPLHMAACTANMGVMTELVKHGADPGLIDGRGKLPMHYVESRLLLLGKTIDSTSKSRFLEIYRFLQACNTTRDLGCSGALLEGASGMGMYMGADTRTQDVENLEAEDLATLLNGMVSLSLSRPETGDS